VTDPTTPPSQLFRAVNDRIRGLLTALGTESADDFFCECGDVCCLARVHLSLGEYDHLRRGPGRLLVAPEHVRPPRGGASRFPHEPSPLAA
jgi:hypothetical protein